MNLISFTCASPSASWTPSVNPRRGGGYAQAEEHFQPKNFAGSDLYSYDHGGPPPSRILELPMLPNADMATLLIFLAVMKGGFYKFVFTDYDSAVFTSCRVLNFQSFSYKAATLSRYSVTLEIEVSG